MMYFYCSAIVPVQIMYKGKDMEVLNFTYKTNTKN